MNRSGNESRDAMKAPAPTSDAGDYPMHQAIAQAFNPDGTIRDQDAFTRMVNLANTGLTADQQADVDAAVARNGGSHAAALDVQDPQLAAEIDAMFAQAGTR